MGLCIFLAVVTKLILKMAFYYRGKTKCILPLFVFYKAPALLSLQLRRRL